MQAFCKNKGNSNDSVVEISSVTLIYNYINRVYKINLIVWFYYTIVLYILVNTEYTEYSGRINYRLVNGKIYLYINNQIKQDQQWLK